MHLLMHLLCRIEQVMDQPYGGFYAVWGKEGDNPEDVVKGLGEDWEIHRFVIKEHASMGAVHTPIECMAKVSKTAAREHNTDQSISHRSNSESLE